MSRRNRVIITVFAGLALVGTGFGFSDSLAGAQDGREPAAESQEEAGVSVRRRANMNAREQYEEAERIGTNGQQLSRRVAAMLDEARQERDIIRVTCLNDKLTQINANLRTLEQRIENLEAAVESDDRERGGHEYTVITVVDQKLSVLDREASQCIGEDIFETGATTVTTEIDDGSPTVDPTVLPIAPPATLAPIVPPPASR